MTSNLAFTERNIQKANAYLLDSHPEQKSLVTLHTLPSLYIYVWLVNTLTSTAPIGSPIICIMISSWYCEQWERNLLFGSADVCGAGTRDEPLRTSVWEAICYLTLKENSFQFCGSNVLKTHGTAMGTKMAVAFANIFMARIENQILRQSCIEPYPGHQRIFSHVWWDTSVLAAGQQIFG